MEKRENHRLHKTKIDIVIPNFNGKQFLDTCLSSIYAQTVDSFLIIVVDNGSEDGSVDFIRNRYPDVRLIALGENTGFSAAVNKGIKAGHSPFVFLLNNDTELAADCLEKLLGAAEKHSDAFFAPKMINYTEREMLDGAGDGFLRGGVGYRLGTMEKDSPLYDKSKTVFGACGGAAFYRRSMLAEIGLLDEDFFAYLEDVDLNFRANRAGFTCRYIPEARVFHIGSATTGSKINPFTVRLSTRNNLLLLVKNYPISLFIRFFPALCIYHFFWFLFVIKKWQLPAYIAGLFGFMRKSPSLLQKRREVQNRAVISNRELADRILQAEHDVVVSIMSRRESQGKGNWLLKMYLKIFL